MLHLFHKRFGLCLSTALFICPVTQSFAIHEGSSSASASSSSTSPQPLPMEEVIPILQNWDIPEDREKMKKSRLFGPSIEGKDKAIEFVQSLPPELLTPAFVEAVQSHMTLEMDKTYRDNHRRDLPKERVQFLVQSLENLEEKFPPEKREAVREDLLKLFARIPAVVLVRFMELMEEKLPVLESEALQRQFIVSALRALAAQKGDEPNGFRVIRELHSSMKPGEVTLENLSKLVELAAISPLMDELSPQNREIALRAFMKEDPDRND